MDRPRDAAGEAPRVPAVAVVAVARHPVGVRIRLLFVTALAILLAGTASAFSLTSRQQAVDPVRVGASASPETALLAHILAELLEAEGIPAEVVEFGRDVDARQAIELGEVDLLPSYTGAVWLDEFGWKRPPTDPVESYGRVREQDARRGLVWLPPTEVNATFAFVVAEDAAMDDLGDLAALNTAPGASLCVDAEFARRADGLGEVARIYGIGDAVLDGQIVHAPPELAPAAVVRGDCVAGLTTRTDGEAQVRGLRPLADRLRAFPAFVVGAVATEELVAARPEVVGALEPFQRLDDAQLALWNGRVVLGGTPATVAEEAAARLRGAA